MRPLTLALLALLVLPAAALPLAAQPPARWQLTPELRIGDLDRRNYALTPVTDVVVDAAGTMYVAQPMDRTIRVYDRAGRYVRSIGRPGRGPGEFETVGWLGWRGDTLYATDPRLERVTLFPPQDGPAATLARTREPLAPHLGPALPAGVLSDGTVLGLPVYPRALLQAGTQDRVPMVRYVRGDGAPQTITFLNAMGSQELRIPFEPNGTFYMNAPLPVGTLWDLDAGGTAVVTVERPEASGPGRSTFTVARVRADGSRAYTRPYAYTPSPLRRAAADSLSAHVLEMARGFSRGRFDMDAGVRRAFRPPTYEPPVTAVVHGRDGTVWLRREGLDRSRVTWLVLDGDGNPIATVQAPAGLTLHEADRRTVWGTVRDELDVTYLVRYRVQPSPRSPRG